MAAGRGDFPKLVELPEVVARAQGMQLVRAIISPGLGYSVMLLLLSHP